MRFDRASAVSIPSRCVLLPSFVGLDSLVCLLAKFSHFLPEVLQSPSVLFVMIHPCPKASRSLSLQQLRANKASIILLAIREGTREARRQSSEGTIYVSDSRLKETESTQWLLRRRSAWKLEPSRRHFGKGPIPVRPQTLS